MGRTSPRTASRAYAGAHHAEDLIHASARSRTALPGTARGRTTYRHQPANALKSGKHLRLSGDVPTIIPTVPKTTPTVKIVPLWAIGIARRRQSRSKAAADEPGLFLRFVLLAVAGRSVQLSTRALLVSTTTPPSGPEGELEGAAAQAGSVACEFRPCCWAPCSPADPVFGGR